MSSPEFENFVNPNPYRNTPGAIAGSEHGMASHHGLEGLEADHDMDFSMFEQANNAEGPSIGFPVGTSAFTGDIVMFKDGVDPSDMYQSGGDLNNQIAPNHNAQKRPPLRSMQSSIVSGREGNVKEEFGQITPPDEPSNDAPAKKKPKVASAETDPAKSERARNAANKRHEASRKKSKVLLDNPSQVVVPSEGGEVDGSRQKYREKNRLAAAKCRAKKKENNDGLEGSARDLSKINTALKQEVQAIRQELTTLRTFCLAHQPGGDCKCSKIHQYNHNRAQAMATDHPFRNVSFSPLYGEAMPSFGCDGGGSVDFETVDARMYEDMMSGSMNGVPSQDMGDHIGQEFADSRFAFSNVTTPDSAPGMGSTMSGGQQGFGGFQFDPQGGMGNMGSWQ